MANDMVTLTNGSRFACAIVRYESQLMCFKGEGGLTSAVPLAAIQSVAFDAAPPPAVAPAKPLADEVRIVMLAEVDKKQRAKGYLLLMLPVTKYTGLLWVIVEKPQFKTVVVGAHKQSGVSWQKVFDCALDRTGQMTFEIPPGKYRLNIYAVTSGHRKISPADDRPPGRVIRTAEVDIIGGNVTTYSVKLLPPSDQTSGDGVTF